MALLDSGRLRGCWGCGGAQASIIFDIHQGEMAQSDLFQIQMDLCVFLSH